MFEVIEDSEVWRGRAGFGGTPRTALSPPRPGFDKTYVRHPHEVRVSTNLDAEGKPAGISLLGMIDAGRGSSTVALWVPPSGFGQVLAAMVKANPQAAIEAIEAVRGAMEA